jgi:hypothetical protein
MTQQKPALIVDQVVHDALAIWPVGDHVPGRSARAIRTDATVARCASSRTCTGNPDLALDRPPQLARNIMWLQLYLLLRLIQCLCRALHSISARKNKKPRPLEEGTAASLDVPNRRATMRAAMSGSWGYRNRDRSRSGANWSAFVLSAQTPQQHRDPQPGVGCSEPPGFSLATRFAIVRSIAHSKERGKHGEAGKTP